MTATKHQRVNQAKLREQVFERDKGICSLCGIDTEQLRAALLPAVPRWTTEDNLGYSTDEQAIQVANHLRFKLVDLLKDIETFDRWITGRPANYKRFPWAKRLGRGDQFWECDHKLPLIEGGGNDLANCRTLCRGCHRTETAALSARLARRPKKNGKRL